MDAIKSDKMGEGVLSHVEFVGDKRKPESNRGGESVNRRRRLNMNSKFIMIKWNSGLSCMNKEQTIEAV